MTFLLFPFHFGMVFGFPWRQIIFKRTPPTGEWPQARACCAEVAAFGKARDKPKSETSRDFDLGNHQIRKLQASLEFFGWTSGLISDNWGKMNRTPIGRLLLMFQNGMGKNHQL